LSINLMVRLTHYKCGEIESRARTLSNACIPICGANITPVYHDPLPTKSKGWQIKYGKC